MICMKIMTNVLDYVQYIDGHIQYVTCIDSANTNERPPTWVHMFFLRLRVLYTTFSTQLEVAFVGEITLLETQIKRNFSS